MSEVSCQEKVVSDGKDLLCEDTLW